MDNVLYIKNHKIVLEGLFRDSEMFKKEIEKNTSNHDLISNKIKTNKNLIEHFNNKSKKDILDLTNYIKLLKELEILDEQLEYIKDCNFIINERQEICQSVIEYLKRN